MRSLRTKISLWYFISFTGLFFVFILLSYTVFQSVIYNHFDSRLVSLAGEFSRFLELSDPADRHLFSMAGKEEIVLEVYRDGTLYLSFQSPPGFFKKWVEKEKNGFFSDRNIRFLMREIPQMDMILIVGIDLQYYFRDLPVLFGWMILIVIVCILSIWWIGRGITKRLLLPLQQIGDDLVDIVNSDISGKRIVVRITGKEIDDLVFAINLSLGKIEKYLKEVKGFSSNMAHELRTPLTLVKMTLQNLQTADDITSVKKEIKEADQEVEEAIGFLNDLLVLSNLEKGIIENFQTGDLGEIALQSFEKASKTYPKKRIDIDIDGVYKFRGAVQLLSHALYILMDNACKYGVGEDVWVKLYENSIEKGKKRNPIVIEVSNFGKRVYLNELKKTTISKGHGLGLHLCERIVQLHSGKLGYTYTETNKTGIVKNTFRITLP
jgi:signal transduction histidine kinase